MNNPTRAALYSNATAGVLTANQALDVLGSPETASTDALKGAVSTAVNGLRFYYATAEGRRAPIRASDAAGAPGLQTVEEYRRNFNRAQSRLGLAVRELLRRGQTYEQLGRLPVSGDWVQQSLDAGNRPQELLEANLGRYSPEAQQLIARAFQAGTMVPGFIESATSEGSGYMIPTGTSTFRPTLPAGRPFTPQDLLTAAMGPAPYAPADKTKVSGLITAMYGGPLWTALARMGFVNDPVIRALILEHFDPWAVIRSFDAAQLAAALQAPLAAIQAEQQARQNMSTP